MAGMLLFTAGCGGDAWGEVAHQAPFVPIRISIDTDGRLSVSIGASILTALDQRESATPAACTYRRMLCPVTESSMHGLIRIPLPRLAQVSRPA